LEQPVEPLPREARTGTGYGDLIILQAGVSTPTRERRDDGENGVLVIHGTHALPAPACSHKVGLT